jgi:hypothetical protein
MLKNFWEEVKVHQRLYSPKKKKKKNSRRREKEGRR